jgi:hypothetical protein
MAQGSGSSAAAKRLAEEKANRRPNGRRDKYGNSGFGETFSGVMKKDQAKLGATNKTLPPYNRGAATKYNKRGNITEVTYGYTDYEGRREMKK